MFRNSNTKSSHKNVTISQKQGNYAINMFFNRHKQIDMFSEKVLINLPN